MSVMDYGAVREINVSTIETPITNLKSFLIRDDAFSRSSATLGRTMRLGDPIDTGPSSAVYQTSWSGGAGQGTWSDTSMFYDSNMNTLDLNGVVRPWPGFNAIGKSTGSATNLYWTQIYTIDNLALTKSTILYFSSDGFIYYQENGGALVIANGGAPVSGKVTAICKMAETGTDVGGYLVFGTDDGSLYKLDVNTWLTADISFPGFPGVKQPISSIQLWQDKLVLNMGNVLWSVDTGPTWVPIKYFREDFIIFDIAVSGKTIYITTGGHGPYTRVHISDGSVTNLLYHWQNAYGAESLSLNGVIYFYVLKYKSSRANPTAYVKNPSLFKYNGSSVSLIHDRSDWDVWGDSDDASGIHIEEFDNKVAFSYTGGTRQQTGTFTSRYVGVLIYDPATDSIHHGPSVGPTGNGVYITDMKPFKKGVAFAIKTGATSYTSNGYRHVIVTRTDGGVDNQNFSGILGASLSLIHSTGKRMFVLSSGFDSSLPAQLKTWLGIKVQGAIDTGTTGIFALRPDVEDSDITKYNIGTWAGSTTPPGTTTATRLSTYDYNAVNVGSSFYYPSAARMQYFIQLTATAPSAGGTSSYVEDTYIESIGVKYMVAPTNRKVWRLRLLCSDGQETLAGAANSLTTAQTQADYLLALWSSGRPFYYWEPGVGAVPTTTTNATLVMATDFLESSYRLDSAGSEVIKEVSLTLYQVQ